MPTSYTRRAFKRNSRTGYQSDDWTLEGRTPRHAQGWRDNQPDDPLAAARGIWNGLLLGIVVWAVIGITFLFVRELLS